MNGPERLASRTVLLAQLLATPAQAAFVADPNRVLLASILAGQMAGEGCLPAGLGLPEAAQAQMLAHYFPGLAVRAAGKPPESIPEWEDLQKLLLDHRSGQHASEVWMADIVATACAGRDHLWQDLGLVNRDELSSLMYLNFHPLAAANNGDMKWKKFLYRQFCAREGIYVCPAPSCGECKDFAKCFGPET